MVSKRAAPGYLRLPLSWRLHLANLGRRLSHHDLSRQPSAYLDVLDCRFDGVLRQHAAVQLHGRQAEVLGNVPVLDGHHLLDAFALDPLRGHTAAGDGRPAAERLEAGVRDVAAVVHPETQQGSWIVCWMAFLLDHLLKTAATLDLEPVPDAGCS
jgi:hypothetical protein